MLARVSARAHAKTISRIVCVCVFAYNWDDDDAVWSYNKLRIGALGFLFWRDSGGRFG